MKCGFNLLIYFHKMLTFTQQKVSLASLFRDLPVWSRDMGQAPGLQQCQRPKHTDQPAASVAGAPNVDHAPLPAWLVSCVGEIWNSPQDNQSPFQKNKSLHKNRGIGFINIDHDIVVLGTRDFKRYFSASNLSHSRRCGIEIPLWLAFPGGYMTGNSV